MSARLFVALELPAAVRSELAAFGRASTILAEELGIDPSPELMRLHQGVLRQDPNLLLRGEPLPLRLSSGLHRPRRCRLGHAWARRDADHDRAHDRVARWYTADRVRERSADVDLIS